MGTSFSDIFDLFMMLITDYRLLVLFDTSSEDFETYLSAWLKFSVVEFEPYCNQDLTFSESTNTFSETLTTENITVLAKLMEKFWMNKNVQDITQQNLHVTDRDFKLMSEAQNLREKVAALNALKEQCSQMLTDYAYRKNDWTSWIAQDFGV